MESAAERRTECPDLLQAGEALRRVQHFLGGSRHSQAVEWLLRQPCQGRHGPRRRCGWRHSTWRRCSPGECAPFLPIARAASNLKIATAASDQVQQVPLASGELGDGAPPAFSIVIGLLEMGSQQGEQRPVALGEVKAGFAEEEEPNGPAWPASGRGGSERQNCMWFSIPCGLMIRGRNPWNAIGGPSRSHKPSRCCAGLRCGQGSCNLTVPVLLPKDPAPVFVALFSSPSSSRWVNQYFCRVVSYPWHNRSRRGSGPSGRSVAIAATPGRASRNVLQRRPRPMPRSSCSVAETRLTMSHLRLQSLM